MEVNSTEKLVTKTVVSFPKDGTIQAVASVAAYPSGKNRSPPNYTKPSAPPMLTSG